MKRFLSLKSIAKSFVLLLPLVTTACQQDPYPKSQMTIAHQTKSPTLAPSEMSKGLEILDEAVLDLGTPAVLRFRPDERSTFSLEGMLVGAGLQSGQPIEAVTGLPDGASVDLGSMTLSWEPSSADAPLRKMVTFEMRAAHLRIRKELILEVISPIHEEAL